MSKKNILKETTAKFSTDAPKPEPARRRPILTAFTPNLMDEQTLKAIFVARQPLVKRIVRDIGDATTSNARRHALLIGPRGIGKTHMVSMVYYGVKDEPEIYNRLRIAWLREEEWSVYSYADLLVRIFRALANEYPEERTELSKFADKLMRMPVDEGEKVGEAKLLSFLGDRLLLLIAENINDLFSNMGVEGQQALRAFLQNHSAAVLVTTSPSLTDDLSNHDAPFYGFFNTTHLKELTRKEATELLSNIATTAGDTELTEYLTTEQADSRLRVIEALAGGHPRIWILFSGCMSKKLLDELVPLFVKMLDDLTPYYQERMRSLPPQERRIVAYLCEISGAVSVRDIADACRMKPNAVAALLGKLAEKAFVREAPELTVASTGDRRITYYEMREPLMRLCIEVKENRAEPLKLIVEFLRLWFKEEEIKARLDSLPAHADLTRRYLEAALERIAEVDQVALNHLWKGRSYLEKHQTEEALESINQAINLTPGNAIASLASFFKYLVCHVSGDSSGAGESLLNAINLDIRQPTLGNCFVIMTMVPIDDWQEKIFNLVAVFRDGLAISNLIYGLIGTIRGLFSEGFSDAMAEKWLAAWEAATQNMPEMDVAMRLLRATVDWKRTRDRGALLRLASEEREILEQILKSATEKPAA